MSCAFARSRSRHELRTHDGQRTRPQKRPPPCASTGGISFAGRPACRRIPAALPPILTTDGGKKEKKKVGSQKRYGVKVLGGMSRKGSLRSMETVVGVHNRVGLVEEWGCILEWF